MKSVLYIKSFFRSNRREFRFFLLFIIFFVVGQVLYNLSRPYITPLFIYKLNASISSMIINIITPGEETFPREASIESGNVSVNISEGCEGIEGILLIIAAISAFYYMGIREKIFGIITGVLILYFSNITRIVALYYTFKYTPEFFDVMHILVGQTVIIFIGVLFFIIWTGKFAQIYEKK